jgi:hypothetical protein
LNLFQQSKHKSVDWEGEKVGLKLKSKGRGMLLLLLRERENCWFSMEGIHGLLCSNSTHATNMMLLTTKAARHSRVNSDSGLFDWNSGMCADG